MKTEATIIHRDVFVIDIDEDVWNKEQLSNWGEVFFEVNSVQEVAEHLAHLMARLGGDYGGFFNGFGYVKILDKNGRVINQLAEGRLVTDFCKGIIVKVVSEGVDVETKELINNSTK